MKKLFIALSVFLVWASVAQAGWLSFGNKKAEVKPTTTTTLKDVAEFVPWMEMSSVSRVVQENAEYIASCMQYMKREDIVCGRYVER